MTTPLESIIRDRIRSEGPMRFDVFMDACLYHPRHGYYSQPGRIGRGGHYLTSPELDPAFGILWRRAFARAWASCGYPRPFTIVELGPGEGGFAAALLEAPADDLAGALELLLVERSPEQEERQRRSLGDDPRVSWARKLPEGEIEGCIFANEVLDNQPVRVLERDRELFVTSEGGRLATVWLDPSPGMETPARAGEILEVSEAAVGLARAAGRSLGRGAVVFVDYGHEGAGFSTLASYGSRGASSDVLEDPGERDITAHVDLRRIGSVLAAEGLEVAPLLTQREALHRLGIGDADKELRKQHQLSLIAGEGAPAVRSLSRRGALAALVDPSGLGRLKVLQACRDIPPPIP